MPKTVYVTGAGFTKAFVPDAPLIVDDYDAGGVLTSAVSSLPTAKRLLEIEKNRCFGKINLERLMTRLETGMPYDPPQVSRHECDVLLHHLKEVLLRRLGDVTKPGPNDGLLCQFASKVLSSGAHCITFNYDEWLDRALNDARQRVPASQIPWTPSNGYGFECRWIGTAVAGHGDSRTSMVTALLLKLHGSSNWRVRTGYLRPYVPEAIARWDKWSNVLMGGLQLEEYLEPGPFIVPPLLTKPEIEKEPVLRVIWQKAAALLEAADEVVFLGYSMPQTDIASRTLFAEKVPSRASVTAVVKCTDAEQEKKVRSSYEDTIGRAVDWHNEDALTWIRAHP